MTHVTIEGYLSYSVGRKRFCDIFSDSSTGSWAELQLPCCPCKQGELPENMLQNLLLNLPPQTVQGGQYGRGQLLVDIEKRVSRCSYWDGTFNLISTNKRTNLSVPFYLFALKHIAADAQVSQVQSLQTQALLTLQK